MSQLADLFEYNQWANERIFAATDQMADDQLQAPMPELGGSALGLLDHLVRVEQAFLALMTGGERPGRGERTYAQVREGFEASTAGYRAALPGLEPRLTERFTVPWFEREFTIEQALLQVATHSVQHRAGICAGIFRAGLEAPELDYIMWLEEFR
jgi:uncharacterized damage-inducible protein DinB